MTEVTPLLCVTGVSRGFRLETSGDIERRVRRRCASDPVLSLPLHDGAGLADGGEYSGCVGSPAGAGGGPSSGSPAAAVRVLASKSPALRWRPLALG